MLNREKVIILLMAIAVCYGGYYFLFEKAKATGPTPAEAQKAELTEFTKTIAENLGKSAYSDTHAYAITRAAATWEKDPFIRSALPVQPEPDVPPEAAEAEQPILPSIAFAYTGYLGLGGLKMAIINGTEYREGEMLAPDGYFVKTITPQEVVIGIQGKEKNIILPLEEPEVPSTQTAG